MDDFESIGWDTADADAALGWGSVPPPLAASPVPAVSLDNPHAVPHPHYDGGDDHFNDSDGDLVLAEEYLTAGSPLIPPPPPLLPPPAAVSPLPPVITATTTPPATGTITHRHVSPPSPDDPSMLTSFHTLVSRRSRYEVSITDPEKMAGEGLTGDSHVVYRIATRDLHASTSTSSTTNAPATIVRRRFTDFVYLHDALVAEFPAAIVCPLPGKHRMEYLTGDRFSSEFVERRRVSLLRFLCRVTRHPVLQGSATLRAFLFSEDWSIAAIKQQIAAASLQGTASAPAAATSPDQLMDHLLPSRAPRRPDPRFTAYRETADTLETHLTLVSKAHARAVSRHAQLHDDLLAVGAGWTQLGALEGAEPVTRTGAVVLDAARARADATRREDVDVGAHVRDALAMCASVKTALRRRDDKQAEYESTAGALAASAAELAKSQGTYGSGAAAAVHVGADHAAVAAAAAAAASSSTGTAGTNSGPSSDGSATNGGGAAPAAVMSAGASAAGSAAVVASVVGHFIKEKYDEIKGVDHERVRADRVSKLTAKVQGLRHQADAARDVHALFSAEVQREIDYTTAARAGDFKELLGEVVETEIEYFDKTLRMWEQMVSILEDMEVAEV
ncbi:hypothetical protein BC828DRAFT_375890 [Blastocladiella britannica]|nr:hypothetical protein BC828DRAFT_375890 [Blastocladiella britannica]